MPPPDRWALASCCKTIFGQLFSSPVLWGDLHVRLGSSEALGQAFCAWLTKRRAGVQRLHIQWDKHPATPDGLAVLTGSDLTKLELTKATLLQTKQPHGLLTLPGMPLPASQPQVALPRLPAMQKLVLRECDWVLEAVARSLPSKFPALVALEVLSTYMPREATFNCVGSLKTLTHLCIVDCGLKRVPEQLSQLLALKELDLSSNRSLGRGYEGEQLAAHLHILQPLTELTALSLSKCGFQSVPAQLSSLAALGALDLSGNQFNKTPAGLANLKVLQRLTRLNLHNCDLIGSCQKDPGISSLSPLSFLADLDLSRNCIYEVHHLDVLQHLTGLTRLNIAATVIRIPPASIAALQSLQVLDVSHNNMRGNEAGIISYPHLHQLPQLTSLDLSSCNLHSWPAGISQMPSLKVSNACLLRLLAFYLQ